MKKGGLRAFKTPSFSMNGFQFKNHASSMPPSRKFEVPSDQDYFNIKLKVLTDHLTISAML